MKDNRIINKKYDEERALYGIENAHLLECTFEGPADGESALKESKHIFVENCNFHLRYPLWHVQDLHMSFSYFDVTARAPLWYCTNAKIEKCKMFGVKAVRECKDFTILDSEIESPEFGWKSSGIILERTKITAEYLFLDSKNIKLKNVTMFGKYSFQYIENLTIENSNLDTKDAFWHSKNVVVRDSIIKGEYLAWFSDGLTLINCKIIGTQPFCYCKNLKLINCTMEKCDLAFEYSDVEAEINSHVDSIKNPRSGTIHVQSVGEIIMKDAVMECRGVVEIINKK